LEGIDWVVWLTRVLLIPFKSGRAGRVQPGKCWHLFPRRKFEEELVPFQLPEIVRTPLESMCLQVREVLFEVEWRWRRLVHFRVSINQVRALRGVARVGQGGVSEFLKKAVTPPSDTALSNALELLLHIGG
jgi:HrpA-like RNA helicase